MKTPLSRIAAATAAALAGALDGHAVSLNANGLGQGLIYPYYTVRSSEGGNAFNTYLSVVNSALDAKALRVRVREGRAGRAVLEFNLYLSPNDAWTGAVVPTAQGARILTIDRTCTDPAFATDGSVAAIDLGAAGYTGANADGFGDTLDRTREGYVEMIEMATLTGDARAAISHNSAGVPNNCAVMRANPAPTVAPPSGGLWGTLTLINVNSGLDFTLDATALDGLSTRPFFRPAGDPYPDWTSLEIDPVSVVIARGNVYRSEWSRPVDAVSAVLMRGAWSHEYVLDNTTISRTDIVATLPTRHHHVTASAASPPFAMPLSWRAACSEFPSPDIGEAQFITYFNREVQSGTVIGAGSISYPVTTRQCAATGVASVRNGAVHMPPDLTRTHVLGSTTRALADGGFFPVVSTFQNGWVKVDLGVRAHPEGAFTSLPPFTSLAASTRTNIATGQVTTGSHTFVGLPLVGFWARIFINGTLSCGAGSCQGNYAGAFPLRYHDAVLPP